MLQFNRLELNERSEEYGFNRDTFEKVLRLKIILEYINSQGFLSDHLLLKGGTAINLTIFNMPRLSVDIDLDFAPNLSKGDTQVAREKITQILNEYMTEQGYFLSDDSRYSHSLDAFHFNYINAAGNKDVIKIEINYSLREHILLPERRTFVTDAFGEPILVKTVAAMEIFAAKTNALINRAAARDLYDFCNMIEQNVFASDEDMFRKCIIFYATISAKKVNVEFDCSAIDGLVFSKIKSELFPMLAVKEKFNLDGKKQQAKEYIAHIMKPSESEREYMERFELKEYRPELLFDDSEIVERLRSHPMALWKCK